MISEKSFSTEHSSFWHDLIPGCESFIRMLNLNTIRIGDPTNFSTIPSRMAFVNEVAFNLFRGNSDTKFTLKNIQANKEFIEITEETKKLIANFSDGRSNYNTSFENHEIADILDQYETLSNFFVKKNDLEIAPVFSGCGFIDTCAGDVIYNQTLYEIKAGNRNFRSIDIRQLLVYIALNSVSDNKKLITKVGLLNPRRKVMFEIGLDELLTQISSPGESELISNIANIFASGDISR